MTSPDTPPLAAAAQVGVHSGSRKRKRELKTVRIGVETLDEIGRLSSEWHLLDGGTKVSPAMVIEAAINLLRGRASTEQLEHAVIEHGSPRKAAIHLGLIRHHEDKRGWPKGVSRNQMKELQAQRVAEHLCLCKDGVPVMGQMMTRIADRGMVSRNFREMNHPWCPMHTFGHPVDAMRYFRARVIEFFHERDRIAAEKGIDAQSPWPTYGEVFADRIEAFGEPFTRRDAVALKHALQPLPEPLGNALLMLAQPDSRS